MKKSIFTMIGLLGVWQLSVQAQLVFETVPTYNEFGSSDPANFVDVDYTQDPSWKTMPAPGLGLNNPVNGLFVSDPKAFANVVFNNWVNPRNSAGVINFDNLAPAGPVNAFSALFGQGKYFQTTLTDPVNQVAWDQPSSFGSWAEPISGHQALNLNPNSMPSVPIGPGIFIGNYIWRPEFSGAKITQVGFTLLQDKYPFTLFLTVYTKAINSAPGDPANSIQLPGAFVPRLPGPPPPAERTTDTFFGYAADPGNYITGMEVLIQATGFESPDAKAYPHLDDLAFVAVPEPATLGLVTALGLLGVAAVRARGRKQP